MLTQPVRGQVGRAPARHLQAGAALPRGPSRPSLGKPRMWACDWRGWGWHPAARGLGQGGRTARLSGVHQAKLAAGWRRRGKWSPRPTWGQLGSPWEVGEGEEVRAAQAAGKGGQGISRLWPPRLCHPQGRFPKKTGRSESAPSLRGPVPGGLGCALSQRGGWAPGEARVQGPLVWSASSSPPQLPGLGHHHSKPRFSHLHNGTRMWPVWVCARLKARYRSPRPGHSKSLLSTPPTPSAKS